MVLNLTYTIVFASYPRDTIKIGITYFKYTYKNDESLCLTVPYNTFMLILQQVIVK